MIKPLPLDDFMARLQKAKRYDGYIAACCVFHDDNNPSLLVFEDGFFKCMSCDEKGTHQKLWAKLEGVELPKRGSALVDHSRGLPSGLSKDPEVFAWTSFMDLKHFGYHKHYFHQRSISDSTIHSLQLGWSEGWVTVPAFGPDGAYMGLTCRATPAVEKKTGLRFCYPPGQRSFPYFPDWQRSQDAKALVVVFGIFDVLALYQMGYPVVTNMGGGKNAFNHLWLDSFRVPILVVPDAGEREAGQKLARNLGWRGKLVLPNYPDGCKDPSDLLRVGRAEDLSILLNSFFEREVIV